MRRFLMCVLGLMAAAAPAMAAQDEVAPVVAAAQQATTKPTAQETPKPTAASEAPIRPGHLANVRLDVTITDQRATGQPTTKTVSLVLSDGAHGRIRTAGDVRVPVQTGSD